MDEAQTDCAVAARLDAGAAQQLPSLSKSLCKESWLYVNLAMTRNSHGHLGVPMRSRLAEQQEEAEAHDQMQYARLVE